MYKRVAVVEDFFDIIYREHVEFQGIQSGRAPTSGKHAGQKRTYRAVSWRVFTQTYLALINQGCRLIHSLMGFASAHIALHCKHINPSVNEDNDNNRHRLEKRIII